ncbi:MAG: ADP-ribosyltransferase [Candidatus Rickettsia vulgarisii]
MILRWNKKLINYKELGDIVDRNLAELIEKVNFSHLSVSQRDIKKYANYVTKKSGTIPIEEKFKEDIEKKEQELIRFKEKIENKESKEYKELEAKIQETASLNSLDYGEKIAIYRYTGSDYSSINRLLKGFDRLDISVSKIPLICLDAAIASHGLNKLPDIELPMVVRYEGGYQLDQHLEEVKNKKITQEKAFTSTSLKTFGHKEGYNKGGQGVVIIYQNVCVRGKYVSPISQHQSEEEYLISPDSQIAWTGYQKTQNGHVFTARGANNLLNSQTLKVGAGKSLSSIEQINKRSAALASYNMMISYKETSVKPFELKGLSQEIIDILSSNNTIEFFQKRIW